MSFFIKGLLSCILIFSSTSNAQSQNLNIKNLNTLETESWHFLMNSIVANQPKVVGVERFVRSFALYPESVSTNKVITELKKIKEWPSVLIDNDVLIIKGFTSEIKIELLPGTEGAFLVNNKKFRLDPTKDALKQFQDFIDNKKYSVWAPLLAQPAYAGESGQVATLAIGGALLGTVATVAGTMLAGSAAAGITIAVGGAGLVLANVYCGINLNPSQSWRPRNGEGSENSWKDYANCITTPLSTLGINPRDRMYLENISSCDGKVEIKVASSMGRHEIRKFQNDQNGQLAKIIITESHGDSIELTVDKIKNQIVSARLYAYGSTPDKPSRILLRPENAKELDSLNGLITDYKLYKDLCAHDDRRRTVLANINSGKESTRASDGRTAKDLVNSSR